MRLRRRRMVMTPLMRREKMEVVSVKEDEIERERMEVVVVVIV